MQHPGKKLNQTRRLVARPVIRLTVLLALVLLMGAARLLADIQTLQFHHTTIEQGLSQSSVFCIQQDRQGFMWFGTEDGLNRYDGNEIKVYRHDPQNPASLSDNFIRA